MLGAAARVYSNGIGGVRYALDRPLFVLATENPIEQEGTHPLPEAQLDRFMFNVLIDYPSISDERRILGETTTADDIAVNKIATGEELESARRLVRELPAAANIVSGEDFNFTEGTAPLAITRTSERAWTGRGTIRLDTLGLVAGDVVVYRGVATDRRPGAAQAESDAFFVEISSPGAVAAEGFALDDEFDRYALSQQMVILRTEQLMARAPSLPADSVADEAMTLAAMQRSVRAEFVFMMGGELADEVLEAEGMGDLNEEAHVEADDEAIAGRLQTQGRRALILAIRSMSRANTALTRAELDQALADEKAALEHLQGAFSRTRYILRALTERERLDLTRRLTGELAEASRDVRPAVVPDADTRVKAMRAALAGVAAMAGEAELGDDAAVRASVLAGSVLRLGPSADALQEIARALMDASTAAAAGRTADARARLDESAVLLNRMLSAELPRGPGAPPTLDANLLDGARVDALRRGGAR